MIFNFRNWVLQTFPFLEDDFDALTDYELFCKMIEYMRKSLEHIKSYDEQFEDFDKRLNDLATYVYNLNIQDAVDNKLDEMVEDGTLQEIVADYLNAKAIFGFDNVASLKSATNLISGSYAKTLGYYSKNDNGSGLYYITDDELTSNDANIILLNNGLYAVLVTINDTVTPEQFGCYGNGLADDTIKLQACIDYAIANKKQINFTGQYKVEPTLQEDNTLVCLKVFRDSTGGIHSTDTGINFNFIRESSIFTDSDEECTLIRFNIANINFENALLKGVLNKTTLIEFSKINKLSATESQWTCYNIFRNCMLLYSKEAIHMEGNTYYNTFDKITIRYCDDGINLDFTEREKLGLSQDSNVNRNDFSNITIQNSTGTCIVINYGDTNKFTNISFEGINNGIFLDDPQEHTGDFLIAPNWYTENNMFINIVAEVVTGIPIYNNAGGSKFVNPSIKYDDSNNNFIIPPQLYIGAGANDTNSNEKVMDIYKSLEYLPIPSTQQYSTIINSYNGHISKYYSDFQVTDGVYKVLSRRNLTFDESLITNLKANTNLIYENNYKCIVKQIGGIVFLSSKFQMQPDDLNTDIQLPLNSEISAVNEIFSYYNYPGMIVPICIVINGTPTLIMCEFQGTKLILHHPENGWSSTIQVDLNLHWYRDILQF